MAANIFLQCCRKNLLGNPKIALQKYCIAILAMLLLVKLAKLYYYLSLHKNFGIMVKTIDFKTYCFR